MNNRAIRLLMLWIPMFLVTLAVGQFEVRSDEPASDETQAAAIAKTLQKRISIKANDLPLVRFAQQLSKDASVEIRFDAKELEAYGVDVDVHTVTAEIHGVELRYALNWILDVYDLAWRRHGSAIEITSPEAVERDATVAIVEISDLLSNGTTRPDAESFERLIELVTSNVAPETWSARGGYGHLTQLRGKLLVHNTPSTIARVRSLLAALRAARKVALAHVDSEPTDTSFPVEQPAHPRLDTAFRTPVTMPVEKRQLYELLANWQEKLQFPLLFDLAAIAEKQLDLNMEVGFVVSGKVTLEEALNRICRNNDLAWIVREGGLVLTAGNDREYDYEPQLETRMYPALDLLGNYLPGDAFDDAPREFDLDDLREMIVSGVDANSWFEQGGPGAATSHAEHGLLVVSQTRANLKAVERLLNNLRRELAKLPRTKRELDDRAEEPMRLVVYSFATPESVREKRRLEIQRSEAAARAKRAARNRNAAARNTLPDAMPFDPQPPGIDDDPFAPPKPGQLPDPFDDDCPFSDGEVESDRATRLGPPGVVSGEIGIDEAEQDPFGGEPVPFDSTDELDPNPFGEFSLSEPDEEADLHAYDPEFRRDLPITEEEFLDVITHVIEPASWVREKGTLAKTAHRRIVIRHTDAVHRKIRELAERLHVRDFREIDQLEFGGFGGGLGGGFF